MALLPKPDSHEFFDYKKAEEFGLFNYDPKKSIAYTRELFKTMALFYDQIYLDWFDYNTLRLNMGQQFPADAVFLSREISGGIAYYMNPSMSNLTNPFYDAEGELEAFTKGVMKEAKRNNICLTPIYGTLHELENKEQEDEEIMSGEYIDLTLDVFPGIDESNLDWEQVDEIRCDIESIGGFRAVRNLIRLIGESKSVVEAEDKVGQKIAVYENACKKHGVKTLKTFVNQLYNKETLFASIGTGLAIGSLELSLALGGIKLTFDTVMNIKESKRDKRYLIESNSEAAAAVIYKKI